MPKTILVVEDEPLVREMLVIDLEDAGFAVLTADSGETALAHLASETPIELLFTDIKLVTPMTGWTIAREARALRPGIGVIYATGYAPDIPDLVEGARFFKKPYIPTQIVTAANEMLG
ncbi:response regulator [Polymorphobacter fuscus]|uniref:Response regulator n=1 Tax=Sandarakinorhabdus fusca TaxID=1439888 RepID=A0A7C9GP92_9SPHN|nr:response regulator [Polymorphobacter fuscus]KAB7646174.1 response regulator [Polymorphobacter fuscus]MQT17377.1 response regulator [Polymorphobacter fuscus]NJC10089.1 CheY-like chemotaxis protein [Polymorphobacter fuscus]